MCDNAAFKKLMISFIFLITAMFYLRVFKYNNNNKTLKQNKLKLYFGNVCFPTLWLKLLINIL